MIRLRLHIPTFDAFRQALIAPPSLTDYKGGLYGYNVGNILKTGRARDPPVRKTQWCCQCRGEPQHWLPFYWKVRHAKKFGEFSVSSRKSGWTGPEKIIHIELKRRGAWLGRVRCSYCRTAHQEKYDLCKIGGILGFIAIVEGRLGDMGWPVIRSGSDVKDDCTYLLTCMRGATRYSYVGQFASLLELTGDTRTDSNRQRFSSAHVDVDTPKTRWRRAFAGGSRASYNGFYKVSLWIQQLVYENAYFAEKLGFEMESMSTRTGRLSRATVASPGSSGRS
ncbi:hypothetical protein C8R45DRAFT_1103466 [Mycena sanguinolenta]|nr:hypothetical protein C8R45DRAFT_1103466 [Mycena sanguinolenta]